MELGIKGHLTRGAEVIELLEMFGGNNRYLLTGGDENQFYYILDEIIGHSCIGPDVIEGYKIFSLEDFLEKFLYKIGNKVKVLITENSLRVDCSGGRSHIEVAEIKSMRWDSGRCEIAYRLKDICGEFYKSDIKGKVIDITIKTSKNMEEKKINQMSLANCDLDEVEIVLGDRFELKIEDGKYYAVRKKPIYPNTYEDCCKRLIQGAHYGVVTDILFDFEKKLKALKTLIICRNAYWKIAGEQMGLGKPWEPDFTNVDEIRYGIYTIANKVEKDFCGVGDVNMILTFPTEKMRDAFLDNFRDLIEQCKELL